MGAERDDSDAGSMTKADDGVGARASVSSRKSAPAMESVDFDALRAALGDLPRASDAPPTVYASDGRSSATYSSLRPHAIPPTRAPVERGDEPAVIVRHEDTVPTAPPQMTAPMGGAAPFAARSFDTHPVPSTPPASSSYRVSTPPRGLSHPFPASSVRPAGVPVRNTVPMPQRPPRALRTQTVVVRLRGPTKGQKLLVFMTMLIVFVGAGVAFVTYGSAFGLNVGWRPKPAPRAPVTEATVAPLPVPPPSPPPAMVTFESATAIEPATPLPESSPVSTVSGRAGSTAGDSSPAGSGGIRRARREPR